MKEDITDFLSRVERLTGIDSDVLFYVEFYDEVFEWLIDHKEESTLFWFGYNLAYGDKDIPLSDIGVFDQVFLDNPVLGPYFLAMSTKHNIKFAIYLVDDEGQPRFRFKAL